MISSYQRRHSGIIPAKTKTMMLNNGKYNCRQVVAPTIIEKLATGEDIDAFSNGPDSAGFMGTKHWSYRVQWCVRHTKGKEAFMALGIHVQYIYLDFERNTAIVKQSSQLVSKDDFQDT
jgi:CubicO group peptidase (beta-lactamase class C family)